MKLKSENPIHWTVPKAGLFDACIAALIVVGTAGATLAGD